MHTLKIRPWGRRWTAAKCRCCWDSAPNNIPSDNQTPRDQAAQDYHDSWVRDLFTLQPVLYNGFNWGCIVAWRMWSCEYELKESGQLLRGLLWFLAMSCAVESYGLEIWTIELMHQMKRRGNWLTKVPGRVFFWEIRYGQFDKSHLLVKFISMLVSLWFHTPTAIAMLSKRAFSTDFQLRFNDVHCLSFGEQLKLEQRAGHVFVGWHEKPICFPPTYKFIINSDEYFGKESPLGTKRRTPAW